MDRRKWSEEHKIFREKLKKEDTFNEAKEIFMNLHTEVHITYFEELWDGLDENTFRNSLNDKGRTIAYGIWHAARIEDITTNLLIADSKQVIDTNNFKERLNSPIYDTGNALSTEEILDFSVKINFEILREYWDSVGERTTEIVNNLTFKESRKRVDKNKIVEIEEIGAVSKDESANWLLDFWGKKNKAGILLMPCTRHLLVHLNESMRAKENGKKDE